MSTVSIRPIQNRDASLIVKWRNLDSVRSKFIFQENFTLELHMNWIETKVKTGKVVQFIIEMNTIILDGSIPEKDIKLMIRDSYALISYNPSVRIYDAVRRIPYGRVATYAQVAEMAGDRKMARAVGNALHRNPDPDNIHCYRVVNSKGELSGEFAFGGAGAQARLLEAEGIEVIDGRVDLKRFRMKNQD